MLSAPEVWQDVDGSQRDRQPEPRVVIVAETASAIFGGEALLPLQYFRLLRGRGAEAWLVVHDRTTRELQDTLGPEMARVRLLRDTWIEKRFSQLVNLTGKSSTIETMLRTFTQWRLKRVVRRLVREVRATVVHQPTPVSPRSPSFIYDVGAPVVIGPMNGGMEYPPGFKVGVGRLKNGLRSAARAIAPLTHLVARGKRKAAVLLVANKRTQASLPPGSATRVIELVENGVDLDVFRMPDRRRDVDGPPSFAYIGRLIPWKAVDLLLIAAKEALRQTPFRLIIIGDGEERARLEALTRELDLVAQITFTGFLSQTECAAQLERVDALVLPSLFECGGAVVLEAMAKGLPVIATNWGGPADYLDATTGILVDPDNREQFITGLAAALIRMAGSPELRRSMGAAGRARVEDVYDWQRKIDRMVEIYREVQPAGAHT